MNATQPKGGFRHGMALLLAGILAVSAAAGLWFAGSRQGLDRAYARALRSSQVAAGMRADLYAAAEAEKSAVLAETDAASQDFANQARAAVGRVAAGLLELQGHADAGSREEGLLRRFAEAFAEYRKVDEEVLDLAVQNTNLKALALSFGQGAAALKDMEQALARGGSDAPSPAALRALAEALRIQALHAPHIMEKTATRMDALERDMAAADQAVRAALAALPRGQGADRALAAYGRYWGITAEVLRLSRQNTNLRSLELSLERKTRVLAACGEALRQLEEVLQERLGSRAKIGRAHV
jgi:hypothetical protein